MTKYEKVVKWYGNGDGQWSLRKVRDAVKQGWITEDEYKEITGFDYESDES